MKKQISVIIPTYNEANNIYLLIQSISKQLKKLSLNFEIIVVDDNSPDRTSAVVKKISEKMKNIKCLTHKGPRELGGSILLGIQKSCGNLIIGMDADFNHDPEIIPLLIKKSEKYDLVIASRFVNGGGMSNNFRYISSFLFNLILKIFFNFPVRDSTSGFYIIKKKELNNFNLKKIYYGYGEYHLRLVYFASKHKLNICEVPVFYQNRLFGVSKSNFFKMFFIYIKTAFELRYE